MRVLKICLIVLLVLFVLLLVGGIIFIKTFDINRFKPQIVAAAQSSLGRSVNLGTMDLQASLKEGVRLNVHEVTIGEHPSYGSGDFLKIDEAYIGVDVLAYLLKKQISISKLSIKSPSVNIIIAADGSMNAQTIGKQPSETTYPVPEEEPNTASTTSAAPTPQPSGARPAQIPDIFIGAMEVTGGNVTIVDQSQTPPLTLAVKNLAVGLNGFSMNAPFSFTASAAVFGEAQNLQVEGRAQVNPQTSEVKVSHLKTSVDLTSLPLAEIRKLPYVPKDVPFPRELAGNLSVTVKDLSAGAKGLQSILMDATLQNDTVAIDNVTPGISVAASQINFGLTNFSLSDTPFQWNLSAAYLNKTPNISGQGTASLNMATQAVTLKDTSFKTDLALIPLTELKSALPQLKDVPLPEKLAGQLSLVIKEFSGSAKGIDGLKADINLAGGEVSMKDAAPGVNVAAKAIDATITNLSLNEPFAFNIKAAYLNDLPNIALEGKGTFNMGNQNVRLNDTKFTTDLAKLSFAQLKEAVESLKEVPFPDEAAGILTIAVSDVIAGPQGLERLLADVNLTEGKIVMKEISPGVSFNASQIQFALNNFSIGKEPFSFNGKLATYSDLPNIVFDGKGTFDMKTQQATINDLNVQSDLSSISLDALRQSMASLKDAPLPQSIKGIFKIAIPTLSTGPQGLNGIKGVIAISDGAVTLKELPTPVEDVDAQILMSNQVIELPKVTLNIGDGRVSLQGKMTEPLSATPSVNFMTTIGSLNIAQLMDQSKSDVKVEGFVSGDLTIAGEKIDPKQLMNFLKGEGSFKIEKGKLSDINILRMVLDKLNFIPNLRETVEENLPERFKEKLQQKDTVLTAVTMDLGIDGGNFFVQPLNVEADGFLFEGNGRAAMDQSFSFDGAFIIPEDLAAAMAKAVPEFELLFDELNQIRFPLKVSGQGSKVSFAPDTKYIMTNVMKNKGKQELQKVLNKVFDVKEEDATNPEDNPEGQPQRRTTPSDGSEEGTTAPQQKRPEEILIEGVLDSIFK